ncbi:MAG: hypothetical protein AAGD43_02280 [Pseudomonadota bacterium]
MRQILFAAFLVTSLPTLGHAQQSRAEQALSGVNTGTTFSHGKIDEVVTPYTTSNPSETGLDHNQFTDRINDIRSEDSDQGRVLRATEDSAAVRPEVEIDAQGELFDDANWAHENAEDIAGQYFSDENGQCTEINMPVSTIVDRFCESFPARQSHTCELVRQIWVDRTDFYRCDKRAASYVKVCGKDISYTCQVDTDTTSCLQNNITVSGASYSWSGNTLTVTLPRAGNASGGTRNGALVVRNFTISVADHSQISQAVLTNVQADGALQVLVNGETAGTWGGQANGGFGSGGASCPSNDREGLLTALTKHWGHAQCEYLWPYRAVYAYLDPGNPPQATRGQGRYRYRIVDNGNSDGAIRRYCDFTAFNTCPEFSNLTNTPTVDRNVLRFLDFDQLVAVDPEVGKRYSNTAVQVRVVHETNRYNGGWATVSIEFTGTCCDSFPATEVEVCE